MRLQLTGAFVAMCVAVLAACSRNTLNQAPATASKNSGAIGDSTAFGLRITGFNGPRNRATFRLTEPAYVVALAVIPGERVDPVALRMAADTAIKASGMHQVSIAMPRGPGLATKQPGPGQSEYERCVAQRSVLGAQAPKTTTIYDSTGKPVTREVTSGSTWPEEHAAELQCDYLEPGKGAGTRPSAMPHPDRYLLLIASNVRLTEAELLDRLSAMAVTADDVPATLAGVASALYPDRSATWSGHYTRW